MATGTFLGTRSTDWANPANWQGGAAPHLGDHVAVTADAAIGAGEFYYGSSSLTGATLTLQPATAISFVQLVVKNGAIHGGTVEGAQLYVYGDTSVENTLLQSVVVTGSLQAADVGISGYLTTLDNYYGPGGLWITHSLTVTGAAGLLGNGITLQNAAVTFSAATTGQPLTVESGANLDVASGSSAVASVIGPGSLVNQGTISVEPGAALTVKATLSNTGALTVAPGATLDLAGTLTTADLAGLDGNGQVLLSGRLDNRSAVLDLSSLAGVSLAFGDGTGAGTIAGGTLRPAGLALQASAGASPTVLDGVAVQGLLDLYGSAKLTGGVTFTAASGTPGGAVKVENGTLWLDSNANLAGVAIELANGTLAAITPTQLAPGAQITVTGHARIDGSVTVGGTVSVGNGQMLTLGDASTAPSATVTVGQGAAVTAGRTVAGVIRFGGTLGTLELTGAGALSATLAGFRAGDSVRLDGLASGALSLSGTTLTITGAGAAAVLQLTGGGSYAAGEFQLAAGPGGALLLTTTHVLAGSDNPLFDRAYYLAHYGAQVAASGLDPFQHYLQVGAAAGLNPNAWFDTSFYLRQNPGSAGLNPLLQYETAGWRDGRATSLLFSGAAFWAANPGMAGTNPLIDFVASGASPAGAAPFALGQNGAADPLVQSGYLFAQMGATLLPAANADIMAGTLYKSTGWRALLNPNPMFDTTFYMATHRAEVLASGLDPLTHYETTGWREGYDPSLVFSTAAYLAAHPAAASSGIDPLTSSAAAVQPRALFRASASVQAVPTKPTPVDPLLDTASVARQIATLLPPGGADPAAVAKAYGEGAWRSVAQPNPLFNSLFYLAGNPDVAAAGIDPLAHYEAFGAREGRNPDPLFDSAGYLARNPDVAAAGANPLAHFEVFGWREGRNPDALFDVKYYLAHNPDVAAAQMDPLFHFETFGWREGRNPDSLFDVKYYLAHNPDVATAKIDPLAHYDEFGWREGRNPSAAFDTNAYLAANPAVHTDPLAQYFTSGMAQGRPIYAVG